MTAYLESDSMSPDPMAPRTAPRWDPRHAARELAELRLKYGGDDWLVTALLATMKEVTGQRRKIEELEKKVKEHSLMIAR